MASFMRSLVSLLAAVELSTAAATPLWVSKRSEPIGQMLSGSTCKCFPGEACWPSQQDWASFNQSVDGRLIATVPIGSVCHGGAATYDAGACTKLQHDWHTPEIHESSSSSIMAPFWANMSCDPFQPRDKQCVIGSYIQYAVNVSEISHVQKTLAFAKERNLRFVVRNTGHDYYGKSSGAGALAVWTHHLKSFEVADYSSPHYSGKAIKLGAGALIHEASSQANKAGLSIVGGECPTVGLSGGFTQGGGLGPLASRHGLGADQVLEWKVVLADGRVVTATPTWHSDLYWALSGGGGGSYGVVWEMTIKGHENEITSAANLTFAIQGSPSEEVFYQGVKAFHDVLPSLTTAGGGALYYIQAGSFALIPAFGPGLDKTKLDSILKPVIDKLDELKIQHQYTSSQFASYWDSFNAYVAPSETAYIQIGGRLIPPSVIQNKGDDFISAIRNAIAHGGGVSGSVFRLPQTNTSVNSVNPAWRESLLSLSVGTVWNDTNWEQNLQNQQLMTNNLLPAFAKLLPNGGSAYLNEGDFQEPKWQEVFYGSSYGRLKSLKALYDPHDLFWGRTAVGSENWAEDKDKRLCRVNETNK